MLSETAAIQNKRFWRQIALLWLGVQAKIMDSIRLHLKLPLKFSMKFAAGVGKKWPLLVL